MDNLIRTIGIFLVKNIKDKIIKIREIRNDKDNVFIKLDEKVNLNVEI